MRELRLALAVLLTVFSMTAGASVPADSVGGPRLEVVDREVNLGEFYAIHPQTGSIRVRNVGDEPLVLVNVRGDCGCTGVTYGDEQIQPDSTAVIKVRFNGKGRQPGAFRKMIRIRSNGGFETAFITGTILKSLVR